MRPDPADLGWLDRVLNTAVAAIRPALSPWYRRRFAAEAGAVMRALEHGGDLRHDLEALRSAVRRHPRSDGGRAVEIVTLACRALADRPGRTGIVGALALVRGMMVELDDEPSRREARDIAAVALSLAGRGVHVAVAEPRTVGAVAARLAGPVEALGMRLGRCDEGSETEARREAYASDITVVASRQLAYDHLRDRVSLGDELGDLRIRTLGLRRGEAAEPPLLRGLARIVLDDADRTLLDDARAPLSVSGRGAGAIDGRLAREALGIAAGLDEVRDMRVTQGGRSIELTREGRGAVAHAVRDMGAAWQSPRRREQLVLLALTAQRLVLPERDYRITEGRLVMIDPATGRAAPERSWGHGLQQMVEAKEGVPLSRTQVTLAQLTMQRFLGRYIHLAAIAGDFEGRSGELRKTYRRHTHRLPGHRSRWAVRLAAAGEGHAAALRSILTGMTEGAPTVVVRTQEQAVELGATLDDVAVIPWDRLVQEPMRDRRGIVLAASLETGRQERALFAGRGGEGAAVVCPALDDPIFGASWPARLLGKVSLWLGGQPFVSRLAWSIASSARARLSARLRRAQIEVETRRRKTMAFAGPGV